jgi:hypothetical protein
VSREPITLDALLEGQEEAGSLLATVEPIPDDTSRVRVTPFVPERGCSCEQVITVAKDDIKALYTTDDVHWCCGKRLSVVEVEFANDSLADVFRQLGDSSRSRSVLVPYPNLGPPGRMRFGGTRQMPMGANAIASRWTVLDAVTCGLWRDHCIGDCATHLAGYRTPFGPASSIAKAVTNTASAIPSRTLKRRPPVTFPVRAFRESITPLPGLFVPAT